MVVVAYHKRQFTTGRMLVKHEMKFYIKLFRFFILNALVTFSHNQKWTVVIICSLLGF